ncbi:MAG: Rrf2 family transcriptional regulator [Clostridia bacterium]|nr:Rrf2 family transcriptional regulator [Clostridia bacterium]
MQISSRFTIAIHIFACIDTFQREYKTTSDFLASSINANPVIIRKLLQQLKAAELISVQRGSGGASIAKPTNEITLYDIYRAVECVENGELFHFHENPNQNCPVGRSIHPVLDGRLKQIQDAMENEMRSITIADVLKDTKAKIAENQPV